MKRTDYIDWDSFFMGVAILASLRSKDPSTRNGAVIVDPKTNRIVSTGYNGFPRGCSDDVFTWDKTGEDTKYNYVIHSEPNAIFNATRSLEGCVMYIFSERGYYPCCNCAQAIVQVGIKQVVLAFTIEYDTEVYKWAPSLKMFGVAGVSIRVLPDYFKTLKELVAKLDNLVIPTPQRKANELQPQG